jgi:signal transduction histidine kinase
VQDLQDFAKPLNPCLRKTDIKLIIDKLLEKNPLPENVKICLIVEAEAREILVDSDFINRILYNLLTNAVQAMPNGGNLTIRAYKENGDTLLSIKDTGVGIAEDAKDKLFTPMFTTKSKGQGFGLAVIKRMTEALGGTVGFESQEGKGTTFTVRFPLKKALNDK